MDYSRHSQVSLLTICYDWQTFINNSCLKSTGTRDELSITLYLQSEIISVLSGCLSMPDATSLHHCLQNHYQYCIILS